MRELKKIGLIILLSIAFAGISYLLLNNVLLTLLLMLAFAFCLYRFILPCVTKATAYLNRLDELHSFATSFVMQLASTPSSFEALKICQPYFKKEVNEIASQYGDDLEDFLSALDGFFQNQSYRVLAQLIRIYETQGGVISTMAKSILEDIAFKKTSALELFKMKKRKIAEFLSMWIFAFASLLYLRVGLKDYYLEVLNKNLLIPVFLVLVLFLMATYSAFQGFKNISFEDKV